MRNQTPSHIVSFIFKLDYVCREHEYRCSDGLCIDKGHLCDGVNHCLDGADEIDCDESQNHIFGNYFWFFMSFAPYHPMMDTFMF